MKQHDCLAAASGQQVVIAHAIYAGFAVLNFRSRFGRRGGGGCRRDLTIGRTAKGQGYGQHC